MLKITQQQALKRWDNLPNNLKEAIFSQSNSDILWKICESQHLSEDKIYSVATLTGDAILGFIHPEDLAQEIKTALGINQEIANSISKEINRKIFNPLKTDIDGVYAPVPEEEIEEEKKEIKIVDIEPPKPETKLESAISVIQIPREKLKEKQEEKEKSEEKPEETPEGPLIIHKEEEIKTVLGSRMPKSLGGLFGFLKRKQPEESMGENFSAVPAKIEIGDGIKKEEEKKVRVVHYGGLSTPLPPAIIPKAEIKVEEKIEEKKVEEKKEESKSGEETVDLREFK